MRTRLSGRPATAAVEFALILPLLATFLLGMFEISRGLLVKEALSNAAQRACRVASLPGKSSSDVEAAVRETLEAAGIKGYTTTVLVNDQKADASTAERNDKVAVQVTVPIGEVYWLTGYFVKKGMVASEAVAMLRQG